MYVCVANFWIFDVLQAALNCARLKFSALKEFIKVQYCTWILCCNSAIRGPLALTPKTTMAPCKFSFLQNYFLAFFLNLLYVHKKHYSVVTHPSLSETPGASPWSTLKLWLSFGKSFDLPKGRKNYIFFVRLLGANQFDCCQTSMIKSLWDIPYPC